MKFLTDALDLLEDPKTPPGPKEAACAALLAGLDEHLDVPASAPFAIWKWIRESTSKRWCAAQYSLGQFPNDQVFDAAIDALWDPASGNSLRELAYDVLGGAAHAGRVPEDLLVYLVDRDGGHTCQLVNLISHVHLARGLSGAFLRMVRDRWSVSPLPATRQEAAEIAALMVDPDDEFWDRMMDDPSDDVRVMVIEHLRRKVDPKFGLTLVRKRLEVERVVEVQAELHRAMMALLKHAEE